MAILFKVFHETKVGLFPRILAIIATTRAGIDDAPGALSTVIARGQCTENFSRSVVAVTMA
ncbi:MAG: hypothetical protein LBD64_01645 [Odoribacteraceae bacterium]|nr:hypothetical protein [Odoribacteraceae bacterium]